MKQSWIVSVFKTNFFSWQHRLLQVMLMRQVGADSRLQNFFCHVRLYVMRVILGKAQSVH